MSNWKLIKYQDGYSIYQNEDTGEVDVIDMEGQE